MKEMLVGESFSIEIQLVDHNRKRMHWFMKMKKADDSLAATSEFLVLFVDLRQRKVSAMPDDWFERVVSRNSSDAIGERASRLLDDARWLVSRYTALQCPHRFHLFSCCS
jgi:hypothetical protein